jgi:hypothetical protein
VAEAVFNLSRFSNKMKDNGLLLSILYRINIFLIQPSWKPLTGATLKELNNTDYIHIIAETYLSLSLAKTVYNRNSATSSEIARAAKDNIVKACEYAVDLRELLSKTISL